MRIPWGAAPRFGDPPLQRTFPKRSPPPSFPTSLPPPVPIIHFPFPIFARSHVRIIKLRVAPCAFWGASRGERLHPTLTPSSPHLHPILCLCHALNSVLILLAPMNAKTRPVAGCPRGRGVPAGGGLPLLCRRGSAGSAGVCLFEPGDPFPAAAWGATPCCRVGPLLTNKDKRP